jgi:hypothetical protein
MNSQPEIGDEQIRIVAAIRIEVRGLLYRFAMQTRFATVGVVVCVALLGACFSSTVPYDEPGAGTSSSSSSSSSSSGYYGSTSGYSSSGYTSSSSGYTPPPPECKVDDDCVKKHAGDVDAGADRCVTWSCSYDQCRSYPIKNTAECQCNEPSDCDNYNASFTQKTCNNIACTDHKCSKTILPAGPASTEKVGDCAKLTCNGTDENEVRTIDAADIGDDNNPCTTDSCDAATGTPKHVNVTNGTVCGDGAICMEGKCHPCKPTNAACCGGEGAGEPANSSSATPQTFTQFSPMCTFSDGTDVDWYTFYATDGAFTHDYYHFKFWSTAPVVELCIYVKCTAGSPDGGCTTKLPGPNGSLGCCWSGAPATLEPTWDLDCSGSSDDAGTTYISVKTPGGDACEQYAIYGGY